MWLPCVLKINQDGVESERTTHDDKEDAVSYIDGLSDLLDTNNRQDFLHTVPLSRFHRQF